MQRFNQEKRRQGEHTILDAYLSRRIVGCVVAQWLKLVLASWRLRLIRQAFRPQGSHVSLWPVMRHDWFASMRGTDAVSNLMWIMLFDAVLREIPRQATGLYAHENQAWERALIRRTTSRADSSLRQTASSCDPVSVSWTARLAPVSMI